MYIKFSMSRQYSCILLKYSKIENTFICSILNMNLDIVPKQKFILFKDLLLEII